jgi:hypothetical protein
MSKEIWPNFFIVGSIRSGTTSLYEYLKQISSIYMPSIKEPNYFTSSIDKKQLFTKPISNEKKYLDLFKNVKDEKAIGDASPTYLWDPKSASMIHEKIPEAKIIIILRNPIERAYSHYLMLFGRGVIKSSFKQIVLNSKNVPHDDFSGRVINAGFYSEQIKRYFDVFPKNQIKILIFEEFVNNTKKSVQGILNFLEIDDFPPDSINTIYNQFTEPRGGISSSILKNKIIKNIGKQLLPMSIGESMVKNVLGRKAIKPKLSEEMFESLENIYKEDIIKVEIFLDRNLPWLTKK